MSTHLEMHHITKIFYGSEQPTIANNEVDLTVKKGEIHAIIGENGAGKSTLMNILYGLVKPDNGWIELNGKRVEISTPKDAIRLKIGMVHQHFMLVPSFTIAENIILGNEPHSYGMVKTRESEKITRNLAERYGLNVDPIWLTRDCSVGIQQRAEILKVLYRGAEILVLDEPTSVLTPQETTDLFSALKRLSNQETTIIFITHKLREVVEVSNRVTVMRGGMVVGGLETKDATEKQLAEMMVGHNLLLQIPKKPPVKNQPVLEVSKITVLNDWKLKAVKDLSFTINKGEVVGIAGVAGNGQEELIEAIIGQRPIVEGLVTVCDKNITNLSTGKIRSEGIGHIPDDRYRKGCSLSDSIVKNMIMGKHNKEPLATGSWINMKRSFSYTEELIKKYDIRTSSPNLPIKSLSGGNAQKVIAAREIGLTKKLLVAEQPTRGIDIVASEFIHNQIVELRNQGVAVLLVSTELTEILKLSSRILVMYQGEIVGERRPEETTEQELGLLMAGIKPTDTV